TDTPLVLPSVHRRNLHRDLETIILKAMAKHPGDRYASADAMADDLRRFRQGLPVLTRRPGPWRGWMRSAWRHRTVVATIALIIFTAAGTIALALRETLRQRASGDITQIQTPPDLTLADWVDEATGDGSAWM